jgi:hypothetical protein
LTQQGGDTRTRHWYGWVNKFGEKIMRLTTFYLLSNIFLANVAYSSAIPTAPKQTIQPLGKLNSDCRGCLNKGLILFGNDKANLGNGKFFDNFFVGSKPKGFMLANAPTKLGYKEILSRSTWNSQAELEKFTTELARGIRLIVWHKDYRDVYFLEPKDVIVQIKQGLLERLNTKKDSHCEKDQCQPTVTIAFEDRDGEYLELRYFSTWTPTISRKNKDVEKIGSDIRYGNLYFGHDSVSVDLLARK